MYFDLFEIQYKIFAFVYNYFKFKYMKNTNNLLNGNTKFLINMYILIIILYSFFVIVINNEYNIIINFLKIYI